MEWFLPHEPRSFKAKTFTQRSGEEASVRTLKAFTVHVYLQFKTTHCDYLWNTKVLLQSLCAMLRDDETGVTLSQRVPVLQSRSPDVFHEKSPPSRKCKHMVRELQWFRSGSVSLLSRVWRLDECECVWCLAFSLSWASSLYSPVHSHLILFLSPPLVFVSVSHGLSPPLRSEVSGHKAQ